MNLDQQQAQLYRGANLASRYTLANGLFVLPVAEEPPTDATERAAWSPVVIVRAHADYRLRHVSFMAEKEFSPPRLPSPTDSGVYKFIGGEVTVPFPSFNTAGGFRWQAQSELMFVEDCYSDENSGYITGQLPYLFGLQEEQAAIVSNNVIGAPQSVQQAGVGPRVGYNLGQTLDFNSVSYFYSEPSFVPAVFHSTDMLDGPDSYQ